MSACGRHLPLQAGCRLSQRARGTMESIPSGLGHLEGVVAEAVKVAIDFGYRHFDCAYFYHNETVVYLPREVFGENSMPQYPEGLNLDYLDLYLIHWPMGFKPREKDIPLDCNGMVIPSNTSFLDTWEAMEDLVIEGLVRKVGVSNFNHEQLETLLNKPGLRFKPVTNQIECHPYLAQKNLIDFCHKRNVSVTAYCPLAKMGVDLLDDDVVQKIAKKHAKSPAQILIRFQIQRNVIVIPKSATPSRIRENIQVFDFELTEKDMEELLSLDKNLRLTTFAPTKNHKDYPFHIEY
ncbi:hypothetical protein U0070_020364 [Myodes glareolus]|uniref:NADP-dependent oxidoreductase domain-containing protein n=1 Tax=Myodes glareolus TaxID=447135 RepID=A0AAW0GWM4_MYOGA